MMVSNYWQKFQILHPAAIYKIYMIKNTVSKDQYYIKADSNAQTSTSSTKAPPATSHRHD
jgi:hypothetical protein